MFDDDDSGNLNFAEFIQADSVKNLDTPEDKLGWMFDAFDADGGWDRISLICFSSILLLAGEQWTLRRSRVLWWGCSGQFRTSAIKPDLTVPGWEV